MDDELQRLREKKLKEMLEKMEAKKGPEILKIGASNLGEVLREHRYLIVDFWAEWCGPCRTMAPIFEELATELRGKIAFGKCNTDENPRVAVQFSISAIPTLIFFANGRPVDQLTGAYPKDLIRKRIAKVYGL